MSFSSGAGSPPLGRLVFPDTLEASALASGFEKLLITFSHAEHAAGLPPHHRDPFDRMLVVQAWAEGLTLVTHDRLLAPYEVDPLGLIAASRACRSCGAH
jgi:PIN domain nuclease of toxin-antitoxin system